MSGIEYLRKQYPELPLPVLIKAELIFNGVRYTPELGEAANSAIRNYQPYKFTEGEYNPTMQSAVDIPYLIMLEGEAIVRVLGNGKSPYSIKCRNGDNGYVLFYKDTEISSIGFQTRPRWQDMTTSDGTSMANAGVSQHGDMLIINPTPGCEYFIHKNENSGDSMRCLFCHYGIPGSHSRKLGQVIGTGRLAQEPLKRVMEICKAASDEVNHYYLVGGSMIDNNDEGERFVQLAEAVNSINTRGISVCCGSSSLKREYLIRLKKAGVSGCCFNLEVWDEKLWKTVCPGKDFFVGRQAWIQGLLDGVDLFGEGNVMSAFVTGMEFSMNDGLQKMEDALGRCLEGIEWFLKRGILSLYSILWPPPGENDEKQIEYFQNYFLKLNIGAYELRKKYGLTFPNSFVCHRCTYLQLECDFDHYVRP